ncbi:MAG: acyl carrier protein [Bacteroidales bacterium]|nr:acyl carrier protein [Bacteroidales bacterium]MCF8390851.1 acyl carrier protein [Bacteroidales bacterium]
MEDNTVDQKLQDIFKSFFRNVKDLKENTSSKDIPEWDSLRHVMLITEIENQFEIKFDLDEMLSMSSFGEIRQKVSDKIQ